MTKGSGRHLCGFAGDDGAGEPPARARVLLKTAVAMRRGAESIVCVWDKSRAGSLMHYVV